MGYRSQVACCISVDTTKAEGEEGAIRWVYDKDKFKEMIGFIKLTKFYELWTTNEHDQKYFGWRDGKFMFYGDAFKWYPDYEDVRAFHDMFNQLSDIEGISGYFLRVGEESGDIEEDSFGDDPSYDYFHAYTGMSFQGEDYLGERDTNEEGQTTQDATTPSA